MAEFDFRNLTRPMVLDGATGTQLQKRGMPAGCCSELWLTEHPEAILDLQRRYVQAGSDLIYAPTFGANRETLGRHGCADRVRRRQWCPYTPARPGRFSAMWIYRHRWGR